MGTDLYAFAEVRQPDGTWRSVTEKLFPGRWDDAADRYVTFTVQPFEGRNRVMFDLFTDVGYVDGVMAIAAPRGLPADVSAEVREHHGPDQLSPDHCGWFGASWLLLSELLAADYDVVVPSKTYGPGPLRDCLGERFFDTIDELKKLGAPDAVRIVVWLG